MVLFVEEGGGGQHTRVYNHVGTYRVRALASAVTGQSSHVGIRSLGTAVTIEALNMT